MYTDLIVAFKVPASAFGRLRSWGLAVMEKDEDNKPLSWEYRVGACCTPPLVTTSGDSVVRIRVVPEDVPKFPSAKARGNGMVECLWRSDDLLQIDTGETIEVMDEEGNTSIQPVYTYELKPEPLFDVLVTDEEGNTKTIQQGAGGFA